MVVYGVIFVCTAEGQMDRSQRVKNKTLTSIANKVKSSWECEQLAAHLELDMDLVTKLQHEKPSRNPSGIAHEIFKEWVKRTGGGRSELHEALNCTELVHLVRDFRAELLVDSKFLVICLALELSTVLQTLKLSVDG